MNSNKIEVLQKIRRLTFPTYDQITLDRKGLQVINYLFLNPDCQADIKLASLTGPIIKLASLGQHIITAAPSTLAKYAQKHNINHLQTGDILHCFALEHAHDLSANKIDIKYKPHYALAHLLNFSQVKKIDRLAKQRLATLESRLPWGKIIFKKVFIPNDLKISVQDYVYHHFGVVVARDDKSELAQKIYQEQINHLQIATWLKETIKKSIVIDFSNVNIFQQNVVDNIIHPQKVKLISNPQDIAQGKIKFKK